MMIEIALEADEEWDSSRSWRDLARRAAEAAIAESAFAQLATCRAAGRNLGPTDQRRRSARIERSVARQGQADQRPFVSRCSTTPNLRLANVAGPELLLGDIILARGVCASEADEKGISLDQHASHLLVHGTLHLLGYDHLDGNEAEDMEAREIRALGRLGIANPYEAGALMATRNEDAEVGSRLWRGMRHLIFGEDSEPTLREEIEEAIDEAEESGPIAGDLTPTERQMLRNLLHFGEQTAGDIAVTRGDIMAVAIRHQLRGSDPRLRRRRPQSPARLWRKPR